MDADNDGDDDICFAQYINNRNFRVICKDVQSNTKIATRNIGKFYNKPLSLKRAGQADQIVLWKKVGNSTKITMVSASGQKTNATVSATGKMLSGDWLGTGSQQIGIANGGVLTIFNPLSSTVSTTAIPSGIAFDCSNNLNGPGEAKIVTSSNICKVADCN